MRQAVQNACVCIVCLIIACAVLFMLDFIIKDVCRREANVECGCRVLCVLLSIFGFWGGCRWSAYIVLYAMSHYSTYSKEDLPHIV